MTIPEEHESELTDILRELGVRAIGDYTLQGTARKILAALHAYGLKVVKMP